ncbi:MAG: putative porin [Bacteroidales bacterium]
MIRHVFIILLLSISSGLYAQKQNTIPSRSDTQKQDSIIKSRYLITHKTDTVKKPRTLKEWTLSADYSEEVNIPIDTVFSLSNRFKLADKYSPINATLGNYGLPFYQVDFFDRITDPDKFLYAYYYPFMHLPSNALFMNTQVPYTELDWSFAGPTETSEQTFRVRHSQNINRFINFGLIYDIIYSLGQYNYQRSQDKTFTFYTSYTGEKYKLYFSANINNLLSYENGGITDRTQLNHLTNLQIPVALGNLDIASSMVKNRNLLLVQRYIFESAPKSKTDSTSHKRSGFFGLSGTFSHIFIIESNVRKYHDSYPTSGFYDNIFVSPILTSDSIYSRSIKNTLRFDFSTDETRKFTLGGGVGIRNEISRYYYIIPTYYTFPNHSKALNENSNVLIGRLYNNIGDKFRWIATGELYSTGYRAGDFKLNGEISKSFDFKKGRASWLITGSIKNTQPSIWYDHWGSNNFEWDKNFKKEFRVDLGTVFSYPARKFEFKFNYAIIKNYTDFDTSAFPSQYSGGLSVAAITVSKEIRVWKFHLASDVIIQKSTNSNILDLPLVAFRSAAYFEHLFRFKSTGGKLNTQLGVDVNYNTLYEAYNYMPATGRFYRQEKVTTGDYPFINLFLNFKIKRTRVFVMFDHINAGLHGNNYDMVPLYPMNTRMLRYGLSWTFYD